jgi:hypothetical protein
LAASGGVEPYVYYVTAGSLPPGLALDPETGNLSGTPDTPGIYQFTLSAVDADFCIGSHEYTIIINPEGCPAIGISPDVETLPNASSGIPYEETLTADGGEAPYTWVISAGAMPLGLALDPETGIISGYPAADDVFNFAVTVQDVNGCYGTRAYGVEVVCTLDVTITSPPEISGIVLGCNSITASGVQVVDPGATFIAGSFIVLGDGFSVGPDTEFTAIIDSSLVPELRATRRDR